MDFNKAEKKEGFTFLGRVWIGMLIFGIIGLATGPVYAAKPIKVGIMAVLSGVTGSAGELQVRTMKTASDIIKKQGGVIGGRNFEFKIIDNEGKADVTIRQAKRLVDKEGYKFLIVAASTSTCAAIQHIAQQLDAVIIDVVAMSTFLRGNKYCAKNIFLTASPVNVELRALAKRIVRDGKTGLRWAGLNPDYGFGHDSWEYFTKYIKEFDPTAKIAANRYFPFREPNMVPYIEGILADKPDALFSAAWAGDLYNILSQGAPRGLFKETILATYDMMEVLRIGGGNMVPKTTYVTSRECWKINPTSPDSRKIYQEKYWELYGERPIYQQSCSYDGIMILAEGIRKAGSTDVDKVIEAIEGLEYSGSLGKSVVRPGDRQVVYPFSPTYKLIAAPGEPKPDWLKVPDGGWKMVEPEGMTGCYDPADAFGCPFAKK